MHSHVTRRATMMTVGPALRRGLSWTLRSVPPMLPTPALPFHRPGWIYEEKYDGWRIMAYKRGDTVRLLSRNGIDFTGRFRELAAAIALLPPSTLILDGEVAVFDEHLLSRRDLLRRPDPRAVVTPPIFITFDCAHAGGRDLRHYPLGARREVLETVLAGQRLLLAARRLPAHGLEAWAEVQRRGYEGLVAKDEASAYLGGRTRSWLKVKRRNGDGALRGAGRQGRSLRLSGRPDPVLAQGQASQWGRGEKRERSSGGLRAVQCGAAPLHAAGREVGVPTLSRSVPAPGCVRSPGIDVSPKRIGGGVRAYKARDRRHPRRVQNE